MTRVYLAGFPHSEISGSKPVCGSPKLIAAYHALHRLLTPRHPPYALSSLIIYLLVYPVQGTAEITGATVQNKLAFVLTLFFQRHELYSIRLSKNDLIT